MRTLNNGILLVCLLIPAIFGIFATGCSHIAEQRLNTATLNDTSQQLRDSVNNDLVALKRFTYKKWVTGVAHPTAHTGKVVSLPYWGWVTITLLKDSESSYYLCSNTYHFPQEIDFSLLQYDVPDSVQRSPAYLADRIYFEIKNKNEVDEGDRWLALNSRLLSEKYQRSISVVKCGGDAKNYKTW